jgi:hypothetical protein
VSRWVERDGSRGFDLPFESQINLIYDTETGELSHSGEGRFAYIQFGSEGQVVPGVYISGVRAKITSDGNNYQLLSNIDRVEDVNRGCYGDIGI